MGKSKLTNEFGSSDWRAVLAFNRSVKLPRRRLLFRRTIGLDVVPLDARKKKLWVLFGTQYPLSLLMPLGVVIVPVRGIGRSC